jgi:Fe2+ transport system protein FeoA
MMVSLVMVRQGERARVLRISAGRGLVRRLTEMGLLPGAEIEIISGRQPGPIIIRLQGLRFGLGFGLAKRIFVEPLR